MSQTDQILHALQHGEVVTPIDALQRFGTFRLAARISELREQGYPIRTHKVRTRAGKTIAAYALEGECAA